MQPCSVPLFPQNWCHLERSSVSLTGSVCSALVSLGLLQVTWQMNTLNSIPYTYKCMPKKDYIYTKNLIVTLNNHQNCKMVSP